LILLHKNTTNTLLLIAFLCLSINTSFSQSAKLKNKLNYYFENIPVLKPTDSIIAFLKADTVNYETDYLLDSITHLVNEFDTYHYHFKKDTSDTHIYYRGDVPSYIGDSVYYDITMIGVEMGTNTAVGARIHYRKLKREFSKYFACSRLELFYWRARKSNLLLFE
jgi:hypothetical protein